VAMRTAGAPGASTTRAAAVASASRSRTSSAMGRARIADSPPGVAPLEPGAPASSPAASASSAAARRATRPIARPRPRCRLRRAYSRASASPSPLDAPVATTRNGPTRALIAPGSGRARGDPPLGDHLVGQTERRLARAGHRRCGQVLPGHADHGHPVDAVVGHLAGAAGHGGAHAERGEVIAEGLAVEPLRLRPVDDLLVGVEATALLVQGPEDGEAQLLFLAHREQRVVELLVLALLEGHVHAAEHHVIRQLRDPATQDRLEAVAMRASVPEELDDLDLAGRHLGADRRGDPAPALA